MSTPLTFLPDVTIGNAFTLAVQFTDYTQNFSTVVATAYLAQCTPPYLDPVLQFAPQVSFPIAGNTSVVNVLLVLSGSQTANLGVGSYKGDIALTMTGYGPYTPISYSFLIVPGISLNSLYTGSLPVVVFNQPGGGGLTPDAVTIVTPGVGSAVFNLVMPNVYGNGGQVIVIKNQSPAQIYVTGNIFADAVVPTFVIPPGNSNTFINDGTQSSGSTYGNGYWNVI